MTTQLLAIAVLALTSAPQEPIRAPLADVVPVLSERSAWRFDTARADPDSSRTGPTGVSAPGTAVAVGNGRVFGAAGMVTPACALSHLIGPRYGVSTSGVGGAFGTVRLQLVDANGAPLELPNRRVERTPDAGFVVTEDASAEVAIRATFFAPPDGARILGAVDVTATGAVRLEGIGLRVTMDAGATVADDRLWAAGRGTPGRARARVTLAGARGERDALIARIGAIDPGQTWRGALEFATADTADELESSLPADRAEVAAAAARTAAWWHARLDGLTRYETDRALIRDLLRDARITLLAQTCAETGAVVPMLGDRSVSVRGQSGPLLAFLRFRMWDDARRILENWWRIARTTGAVPVRTTLAEVPRSAPGDAGDAAFWNAVAVPPGDIGSWVILQHFWYWRATRDRALIERHWPLIEACIKRQIRREEILIPFAGDEPWVDGIAHLPASVLGPDPELIGDDPATGRSSDSFASAVAFLMALHAVGDMVDGLDQARRPERWAGGPPDPKPSAAYVRRAFELMAALEEQYWQPDLGYFAPARSPVDGRLHRPPVANANLLPLWLGWTFPSGERSRQNLGGALERLWLDGARIGTTRTLGVVTGDAQGMLVVALAERDGASRNAAVDALIASAAPGGSWSTFHGGDGRPIDGVGARIDPAVLGVNVDALLFATTGIRQAAYANWDDDDIRLELRLPRGATWFAARGASKDGRTLDVFFRERIAAMSEDERHANDELAPDRRRDPSVPHRRVNFAVELVEGTPPKGYYDVAINAEGTVFVRYLQPGAPTEPGAPDLRRIEETEYATDDAQVFVPDRAGAGTAPAPRPRGVDGDATTLVLTCRRTAAELLAGPDVTLFDPALPFAPSELEGLLLADGAPRHAAVYLDWRYDAPTPAGWNGEFFAGPAWAGLLERYRAAGGRVIAPGFVRQFAVDGVDIAAGEDGALRLPGGDQAIRVRTSVDLSAARDVVLRTGSDCPLLIRVADRELARADGSASAEPDRGAWLATLAVGVNEIVIEVGPRPDRGPRSLFLRVTDPRGLSIR